MSNGEDKKRYVCVLTDGMEIHEVRIMTYDEWVDARYKAANATDGCLNWDRMHGEYVGKPIGA